MRTTGSFFAKLGYCKTGVFLVKSGLSVKPNSKEIGDR